MLSKNERQQTVPSGSRRETDGEGEGSHVDIDSKIRLLDRRVRGIRHPHAERNAHNQGHGTRSGGPAHVGHPGQPGHPAATQRAAVPNRSNHSGPLSYNAYWRAAASPTPPRTNQDYNRYWQKMQAWQEHHPR